LNLQKFWLMKKGRVWLQLFLIASLFLYFYSPLLDHWTGNSHYGRPHTHIPIKPNLLLKPAPESGSNGLDDDEHEENVLCILDINALLSVVLSNVNPAWLLDFATNASLVLDFHEVFVSAAPIFLSSSDPPPRI
jgi:hypothetical protein